VHNALIRSIFQAVLFELSVVTRPAYKEATVVADDNGPQTDADKIAAGWIYDAQGKLVPPPQTDSEKLADGWTYQNGILVPPPQPIIKRARPAALRWR
jgi:hypothetical protein